MSPIPIIDIQGLQSEQLETRKKVAAEIQRASHEVGFFYIKNHGVAKAIIDATFAQVKRFFDLPLTVKEQVSITRSPVSRGYEAIGSQTLDLTMQPDLKESFYIGVERDETDPLVQAKLPNHGANQWLPNLPGWREHMEAYFAVMIDLARRLARGLALSLDLDEQFFDAFATNPMPILRLLHYPPHPLNAQVDQIGCGTHTDWGFLTILLQDQAGGLEVCTADGDWIAAEPIPDTFVINLGDLMARWTNNYYQSTPHRVTNHSQSDRYSVPFFWDINYHAVIECLSSCQSSSNPPKYPPITAGEHIVEMYQKTYKKASLDIKK